MGKVSPFNIGLSVVLTNLQVIQKVQNQNYDNVGMTFLVNSSYYLLLPCYIRALMVGKIKTAL